MKFKFKIQPYQKYLRSIEVSDTHKGYFSIDKKTGHSINSSLLDVMDNGINTY